MLAHWRYIVNSENNRIQIATDKQYFFSIKFQFAFKQVVKQPYMTDGMHIKIKDQTVYVLYVNELGVAVTAFTLQCVEAKVSTTTIT